jgi:hypothetical protein
VTDIARLSFGHEDQPEEQGVLVLSDDGTVRVEPSDSLRDTLAAQEERALAQAERYGTRLGLGLIGLGFVAVGLGWYAGRFYGKYAWRRTAPRSVKSVEITQEQAQMRVRLGSVVWDIWNYDTADAEIFVAALKELKHEN